MKKKLIVLLAILVLVSGCTKHETKLVDGKEVVAEVEGLQITSEDFYGTLKDEYGYATLLGLIDNYIISKEFTDEDAATSYAKQQYEYLKASYEANDSDLDTEILNYYSSVQAFKDMLAKNYKSSKVVEKYISESLTDKEIEDYYNSDIYGTMTVRHILVKPTYASTATDSEKASAKTTALNEAKDIITKLNQGADFATLAKENSDDTGTSSNGGLFENFEKDTTDAAFWAASYVLKDNEFTKTPVESAYGYHVILKVSSASKPSLDDSKDKIKEALVSEKLTAAGDNATAIYWAKIREKYKMNISETKISDEYNSNISKLK